MVNYKGREIPIIVILKQELLYAVLIYIMMNIAIEIYTVLKKVLPFH